MGILERRRQRKLEKKREEAEAREIYREGVAAHDERVEAMRAARSPEDAVAEVHVDVPEEAVEGLTRELEKLTKTPVKTAKQTRRGYPNEEIRHYRHLCPYCKMGWDDRKEFLRATCERTGYPHSDPRHLETTRGLELRRKAR